MVFTAEKVVSVETPQCGFELGRVYAYCSKVSRHN